MRFKKVAAFVLALSFVASAGCNKYDDEKDSEELQEITESFITAVNNNNGDEAGEFTDGFDYSSVELHFDEGIRDIAFYALKYLELNDFDSVEFNRDEGTARAEAEIGYFDFYGFRSSMDRYSHYYTADDYYEMIDEFDGRKEKTIRLTFVYNGEDDQWLMSETSARKIMRMCLASASRLYQPVAVTPEGAADLFIDYFDNIAAGEFGSLMLELDFEDNRVYDNVSVRGQGEKTQEALENFISSYVAFVMDHDPQVEVYDDYYGYELSGYAPSSDDLYAALTTDEFLTEYYANFIRYTNLGTDLDEMWDDQSALIYNTLTEAIESCSSEPYSIYGWIEINQDDYRETGNYTVYLDGGVIADDTPGMFEAEHSVDQEQYIRCNEAAIELLLENGEITAFMSNALLENLEQEVEDTFTPAGGTSSSGHPNQAVGTYEQVPEWCEDGSLVYGYSNPDSNGFWMFYSKSPDVLDHVEYYLDDDGMWITCYFIDGFGSGTNLIVDWWLNDDLVVDTEYVRIRNAGQTEVEVFLPWDRIPSSGIYEMRLWEDNHSHVLAYVTMTHI